MKLQLKNLVNDDIGLWVMYTGCRLQAHKGHYPMPAVYQEIGRIKSWNSEYVFVVYHCNKDWDNFEVYTAAATNPNDLIILPVETLKGLELI